MRAKQSQIQNLIIYLMDNVGVIIGCFLATYMRFDGNEGFLQGREGISRLMSALVVLLFVYLALNPNHHIFKRRKRDEFISDVKTSVILAFGMATWAYLSNDARDYSRLIYLGTTTFTFCWMFVTHKLYRWYYLKYRKYQDDMKKLVIVTTSKRAREIIRSIRKEQAWVFLITGVILLDKDLEGEIIQGVPVVANRENMFDYAVREPVDEMFLHLPYSQDYSVESMVGQFEEMGIVVNLNLNVFDMDVDSSHQIERIGKYHTVCFAPKQVPLYMIILKRVLDIVGASVGLLITAVVTVFLAPILKIESPGPLFFSQERIGMNGRRFKIYKFRSMYMDAEERKKELMEKNEMDGLMFKMENDPRITKVGAFIRKTSLDELPQFWNVLVGDMSLVGTRPPTVDEFMQYEGYHKKRLAAKPGITGVWQVSGRSDITDFEEIVAMDVEYISNWTIQRDIKILFQTVRVVFAGSGAR